MPLDDARPAPGTTAKTDNSLHPSFSGTSIFWLTWFYHFAKHTGMVHQLGYSLRVLAINIVAIVLLVASISAFAGTDVLTWHNDLART